MFENAGFEMEIGGSLKQGMQKSFGFDMCLTF